MPHTSTCQQKKSLFFSTRGMSTQTNILKVEPLAATDDTPPDPPCGSDAMHCLKRALVDGAAIIAAYGIILYASDGKVPPWTQIAKFFILYIALVFMFREMGHELDQLTRVAGFQLGMKLMGVLG